MKTIRNTPFLLGAAIALALAGGVAAAQTPAPKAKVAAKTSARSDAAAQAELDAARKDLDRAAKRYAELTRDHSEVRDVHVFERIERKPVIGVVLAPDAQAGVRVAGVTPDSGAAKAGLKSGDRITSIGGTKVLGSTGELRLENARKLFTNLDDGKAVRIGYARGDKTAVADVTPSLDQQIIMLRGGGPGESFPRVRRIEVPGVAPDVQQEIIRIGPRGDCKGNNCKIPMIAEAFRWNGLNLASVDPQLGRYFGTDRGVLVLSAGEDLTGLQAGDVIRKIDGKAVNSPRDAMDALRDKEPNAMALVEYMRDRKVASTRIKTPAPMRFKMPPLPPVPPAPPAPPSVRAPKAPPPPPPPAAWIQQDGDAIVIEDVRVETL